MPRRIILLTGPDEAPFLRELFLKLDPRLEVTAALDLEQLTAAVECCDGDARLIAFLTATIVPSALLSRLKLTPYNIHPGPPEYPGAHPECFAIWEQAQTFGVTAHEVTARVDAGPIVALCRFAMPPEPDRATLSELTYIRALDVIAAVARHCARSDGPMVPIDETWSPGKRTRKEFLALRRTAAETVPADLERLSRACGGGLASSASVPEIRI